MWSAESGLLALDLDGTLIDAKRRQLSVLMAVLYEREMDLVVPELFWDLKREGRSTIAALVSLGVDKAEARATGKRWLERIEEEDELLKDELLPGVEGTLAALATADIRPVVITARAHGERAKRQFTGLGLDRWCDDLHVVAPTDASTQKAATLRALNAAAYVGDTESDAEAASVAEIPFASVATGQRSPAFLTAQGLTPHPTLLAALNSLASG